MGVRAPDRITTSLLDMELPRLLEKDDEAGSRASGSFDAAVARASPAAGS